MSRHRRPTATTLMVCAAYAAQGLGYAAVVTALPAAKDRMDFSDTVLSASLLGVCVAAVFGSGLADAVAARRGSRSALCLGFLLQSAALAGMSLAPDRVVYLGAVAVYGLGLGTVDAGNNMQGVALQNRTGVPMMGRLYSAFTAGGIIGALLSAALATGGVSALTLVGGASLLQLTVALTGRIWLVPQPPARPADTTSPGRRRTPLPRAAIWTVGSLVLVAYVLDAAVSTWSTVYLSDGLKTSDAVAPVGYAAYLAMVLLARLVTDPAVLRWGRRGVGVGALALGTIGCALVVAGPGAAAAVAGFAVAGIATGVLVPIAFEAAGQLLPARSDEVIARVNIFNYAGAVTGAVVPGLLGTGAGLRLGFVAPALALLLVLPLARRLPTRLSVSPKPLPEGEPA
ncbi:MFS transporter [Streptomyces sp. WAC 00631]|uniref:MFS transporter n=1 Tax=unclassified Streptomyces TaxID=2593676 RepID=UPI000F78DD02|nr:MULTISPECIES: MFS transporter [unclassified Streptomyces]MCC5036480.1 MFS transporter [Streptomyces sp. WAC 00631]MCC9738371.1 MFS transporter [Streptomyces sp. MNU89]